MLRFQDMSNLSICSLSIFAVTVIVFPVGKIAIYIFERCHQLNMFFKTECQTSAIEIQSKHLIGRSCMIYQPTPPQKKKIRLGTYEVSGLCRAFGLRWIKRRKKCRESKSRESKSRCLIN